MFHNTALTRTAARIVVIAAVAVAPVGLTAAAALANPPAVQQGDEIWGHHRGHHGDWRFHQPRIWNDEPPVWQGPGYYRPPTGSGSGSSW
ncbi:hypothetical protein [Nocardia sp. alder85J]|uniref:hypothetical protein n=1 Tax=Nocardia sp. alder85J TaxID=2862949 RepID=UPI001CD3B060|nr:hypothetical protein [Nocardia sp. alder85J]MCX4096910.1 hypothetical protein [Nocardia sp. alder85J]